MTAYVNEEQKKEGAYGKAVKATLAATLAAGMVPAAAAFAVEENDGVEDAGIELYGLDHATAWAQGTFSVIDNSGASVAIAKNFANTHYVADEAFVEDGTLHKVKPGKVVLAHGAGELDLSDDTKFDVTYHKDSKDGAAASDDDMKKAGTFFMVVKPAATNVDWAGCEFVVEFEIAADSKSIDGAELYEVNAADGEDLSDKEFVYKGADFAKGTDLNVAVDGKKLKVDEDYTVKFFAANDNSNEVPVKDAGKYTAVIEGEGAYTGTKSIDFEVQKLDLSKATFEFDTTSYTAPVLQKVNGQTAFDTVALNDLFDVAVVKPASADGKGEYKYTVSLKEVEVPAPKDDAQGNVTNEAEIAAAEKVVEVQKNFVEGVSGTHTAVKAGAELQLADVFYGNKAAQASYTIEPGDEAFDLSKISVKHAGAVLDAKFYDVEVLDAKGNVVDDAKIAETGEWTVRVSIIAKENGYELAGSVDIKVTVETSKIASEDVVWKYDGSLVDVDGGNAVKAVDYDGTDLLEKLDVAVSFGGKKLVEGTDYEMTVTNEAGEKVEEAVEAGKYVIVLESDSYKFEDTEKLTLDIKHVNASKFRVAPASLLHGNENVKEIAHTGEAIAPVVQYESTEKDADGKLIWKDLPAGSYTLSFEYAKKSDGDFKAAKEMKELGFYKVTVADANLKDSLTLSNVAMDGIYEVVEGKVYSDVAPSDWFYTYVYDAENAKYMYGMGNSDVFAPYLSTSRAMAAEVLFRMGGGSGTEGILTPPFSDVNDVDAWYFKSVAWASSMKIVAGYPGTDEFRPGNDVTRAEFCIMMQRYAEVTGQGEPLEAGEADEILAKYADGAAVPEWCKDAVAWAVKNEVFGGDKVLRPADNISRAEMAKMTVSFQPKALDAHKAPSVTA